MPRVERSRQHVNDWHSARLWRMLAPFVVCDHSWHRGRMLITQQGPTLRLFKQIERELNPSVPLADVIQKCCDAFYSTFEQSIVLVRQFVSVPFAMLPAEEQTIARLTLEQWQIKDPIEANTPVMVLLGTRGVKDEWCDRRKSQNHRALPLNSRMLLESMPMTAQLFRIIGFDLDAPKTKEHGVTEKAWGAGRAGLFYVENAAKTVDSLGRKIIGAEPFVEQNGVHTVFGVARAYRENLFMVQLIFCRHLVSRERAREFLPLAAILRGTTMRAIDGNNVFPKS